MRCSVAGGVPHAPASRRKSEGPAMITSEPPAAAAAARTFRTSSAPPSTVQFAMPVPAEAHHDCSGPRSVAVQMQHLYAEADRFRARAWNGALAG